MQSINAILFNSAGEAIQHVDASGIGVAVLLDGQPMVISQLDADGLAAAGVEFAYLCGHQDSGRIMTVPVN